MSPKFNVDYVLANITEDDKIALLSGSDFWHTHAIPRFNVPAVRTTDGPNGIRGTKFFAGVPAACLPCGTALGATWDSDLLHQAGVLLGKECLAKGAHCWLGPTINMQRSPLGGRGFESFAEDPHLSGIMAKSVILGCESTGVISTVKHYVGNDQEHERRAVDVLVTPRALREIYLRPFQIVARDAHPGALMTSYNKINGKHVVENPAMLDIVRKDWNWDPLIMSDWLGTYTTIDSMNAGLDLEMPGPTRYRGKYIESAMQARLIKQSTINKRARKVLEFVERASRAPVSVEETGRDFPEDRALNRTLCANSIVLLKNDGNLLPIPKTVKKIALIGSHVKTPAISGGGSASLEPYYAVSLYDAVVEALPDAEVLYEAGAYAHKMLPVIDRMLSNAVIHFYNEPPEKERTLLATEPVVNTAFQLMDYNAPDLNRSLFWATLIGEFTPDVSGLWDFGLTVFGTATLFIDDEMVIDNTTRQTRGTAFFGKGTVQEVGSKQLTAGQTYKIRIEFGSANTSPMKAIGVVHFGGGAAHLGACLHMDPEEMVANAVKVAAEADYTIVCTGLNRDWESEGFDRPDMDLPPGIDALISSVLDVAADRTVIVNQSGTPVTMPWADRARGIVQAWYGGNETGHGIADVLFGDVNPCGKLPLSWPVDVRHNPAYLNNMSVGGRMLYGEDVYTGYRFYDKVGREVLFSFGHGLSYTTFSVSPEASVSPSIFSPDSPPTARVLVKNTGPVSGAQILQLYIAAPNSATPRPVKELHGFTKVFLHPGEEKTVDIHIDKYATSFWDEIEDMWKSEEGIYQMLIGNSSQEIVSRGEFRVEQTRYWSGV
jgi:beta-glucosidase